MRALSLVLLLSMIAIACSKSTDPATAAYWIDKLDNKREREEALRKLGDIGDKSAVPEVLKWFQEEGEWQPDAAFALGQLGDASAAPQLIAGIEYAAGTGQDRATRNKNRTNQNIARALAMLQAKEGVEPLIKLLGAAEDRTREAVLRALGELRDPRATEPLVEIALNDKQAFLRRVAIEALGNLGDVKGVPALVKMLYVEVPGISFYNESRFALVQIGEPAAAKLIETMKRQNKEVEAVRMADGQPVAEGAVEAKAGSVLGAIRAREAEPVIVGALEAFYKRFQQRDKTPVFASVPGAVVELCYALGYVGSPAAVKMLLEVVKDTDASIRVAAAEALTTVGDAAAVPVLLAAAKTGNVDAKRAALTAASRLGSGGDLAAFDALGKTDKELAGVVDAERVRLVAAGECKADAECWKGKLADANARVRERAAYQLGWLDAKNANAELYKALEDDSAEVRFAAVLALERNGGADVKRMQEIHERWQNKVDYRVVNAEMQRVIAGAKRNQGKGGAK